MATPYTAQLPKEEEETLKASIFQRLHPRVYFERFLAEGVRPDGRGFDAWRDVSVNVGKPEPIILRPSYNLRYKKSRFDIHRRRISTGTLGKHNDCLWGEG